MAPATENRLCAGCRPVRGHRSIRHLSSPPQPMQVLITGELCRYRPWLSGWVEPNRGTEILEQSNHLSFARKPIAPAHGALRGAAPTLPRLSAHLTVKKAIVTIQNSVRSPGSWERPCQVLRRLTIP